MTVVSPSRRKRIKPPDHNDPSTWLHRIEVIRKLNVTRDAVRYMVDRGDLHPIKDARGDALFDPDEVNAYAMAHPKARAGIQHMGEGEITAEAFRLLEEGVTRRGLIMQLRITAEHADKLYEEWETGDDWRTALRRRREQRLAKLTEKEERQRARERAERRKVSFATLVSSGLGDKSK